MFDIGWTELMLIGIVALIVIGPKDLPDMFRTMGRFTAKARGMAKEFSRAMESAADEAGVKDVAKDLRKATSARSMGLDAVKDAASKFEKWDPIKATQPSNSIKATPDPSAPPPTPIAPKGPATQALADAQTAKRAERAASVTPSTPAPKAEKPAPKADKPASKPRAPRKTAPKKSDA
jgi:sec-independent protein translocase protein TatB